jgi:hypothetical protein
MGVKKRVPKRRIPDDIGVTDRSIGVAKGKRCRTYEDPYARGERSGKHAKPDAQSAAANARVRLASGMAPPLEGVPGPFLPPPAFPPVFAPPPAFSPPAFAPPAAFPPATFAPPPVFAPPMFAPSRVCAPFRICPPSRICPSCVWPPSGIWPPSHVCPPSRAHMSHAPPSHGTPFFPSRIWEGTPPSGPVS